MRARVPLLPPEIIYASVVLMAAQEPSKLGVRVRISSDAPYRICNGIYHGNNRTTYFGMVYVHADTAPFQVAGVFD